MTLRARSSSRSFGPLTIALLVLWLAVLWRVAMPPGERVGSYLGQAIGAEAILLMSLALVLISTLPWVEVWFDGIDRAAIWHRRIAITGLVLLLPHVLLAHGGRGPAWSGPAGVVATVGLVALAVWAVLPRWRTVFPAPARRVVLAVHDRAPARWVARLLGNYEHWRALHRTTGVFVGIGFVHGLTDATPFAAAPVLRWTYVVIGGTGLAFYGWRELCARRGSGLRDYQVREVRTVAPDLTEIVLRPLGRPLSFVPGQFAMVHLEANDGWHRHPFTLASAPTEDDLRITVKALGDYTSNVPQSVRAGMPAVVSGPHGRFTHAKGTDRQLWIAGGVGITPFLSWLRSLDAEPPTGRVEFFHTTSAGLEDEVPYETEIAAIAAAHPNVNCTVVRSRIDGRLDVQRVLTPYGGDPTGVSVFLCGPEAMVRSLTHDLHRAGIPGRHLHREHFDWR